MSFWLTRFFSGRRETKTVIWDGLIWAGFSLPNTAINPGMDNFTSAWVRGIRFNHASADTPAALSMSVRRVIVTISRPIRAPLHGSLIQYGVFMRSLCVFLLLEPIPAIRPPVNLPDCHAWSR
jgi:hypothetical protein